MAWADTDNPVSTKSCTPQEVAAAALIEDLVSRRKLLHDTTNQLAPPLII